MKPLVIYWDGLRILGAALFFLFVLFCVAAVFVSDYLKTKKRKAHLKSNNLKVDKDGHINRRKQSTNN